MADKNTETFRGLSQEVGARLAERRAELSKTLRMVASDAEMSASHLSDIENGRSQVSLPTLLKLTKSLDLSITELLPRIGGNRNTGGSLDELTGSDNLLTHSELELSIRYHQLQPNVRLPVENPALEDLLIHVLSGSICVHTSGQDFHLGQGDNLDSERLRRCEIVAETQATILVATRTERP